MNWWLHIMPLESAEAGNIRLAFQNQHRDIAVTASASSTGPVMLVRNRKSRIYFQRKFFDYPLTLSLQTILNLGLWKTARIGFSYLRSLAFPIRNEENLEQFFINRFGRELYRTFFKSYTEKVWGVPCQAINADWGAQRIKGLSILRTLQHLLKKKQDLSQKNVETSLIERFLYPSTAPARCGKKSPASSKRRAARS